MGLIMGAIAVGGAILGGMSSRQQARAEKRAAEDAARMARREAELNWKATQEEVRRLGVTHDGIMEQANVDVGAMGFASDSSSHADKLGEIETEFSKERQFMLDTGMEAKDISGINADLMVKHASTGTNRKIATGAISGATTGAGIASWWTS